MLAENGDEACRSYARRTRLPRLTPNTLTTIAELLREVHRAQQTGIAYDNEEAESGVACIGVLIRDSSGQAVAGLSISAPKERHQDKWADLLRQAGLKLSQRLGYRDD
jgi:DNA-binding IclR family transcriptional regulator